MSGKAGVLFKATAAGNVYFSYGSTVTPPGTANFTLSAQANNQNNPNVKPQESTNYEVGSKWDFANGRLSLNTAIFRTENRNVIFTVDATAIPPIYNQDDSQRVNGVSVGSIGRITTAWEVFANFAYLDSVLDTQNDANRGKRLTADAEVFGQPLDDLSAADEGHRRRRHPRRPTTSSSMRPTRFGRRAITSSMAWSNTR